MQNKPDHNFPHQLVAGVLAIIIGFVFLLDNFGWWDARRLLEFWPLIFIVIGVFKLTDRSEPNHVYSGLIFIAIGAVLTLQRLGWLTLSWKMIWPVLLIAVGVSIILKGLHLRKQLVAKADPKGYPHVDAQSGVQTDDDSLIRATAIFAGLDRSVSSKDFRGGEITAIMGGCDLDLRQASLQGDAVLNTFAIFGGITIKVPTDWQVIVQGTPILGGFDQRTAPAPQGSKRLIIKGSAIMGGVDIHN